MVRNATVPGLCLLVFVILTTVATASCGKSFALIDGGGKDKARVVDLSPAYFDGVGTEVAISGQRYSMDSYIWYDYMPTTDPSTKNPVVAGHILLMEGSNFDVEFTPVKVWILSDDTVWEWNVGILLEVGVDLSPVVAFHGQAGPALATGSTYDVVLDFVDKNDVHYRLRVNDIEVETAY